MNSLNTWLLVILLCYAISAHTHGGKTHTQNNLYSACLQQTYPFKFKGHLIFSLWTTRAMTPKLLAPGQKKKKFCVFFLIFLFSSFLHQFFISLGSVFFLLACLHRAVCMRLMMGWGYRHLSFVQMTFLKLYKSHVVYPCIKTAHRWTVYFMILHLITQLLLYLINWPEDSIQQHWIIY